MSTRTVRIMPLFVAVLVVVLSSCSEEESTFERNETYPITGQILVDGKPEQQIVVRCNPVSQAEGAHPITASAFTDAEGKFSISTYEGGDGAQAGEYKLTFVWGQINLLTGAYGGPDKLKDKYADPESSEFTVTVESGKQNDLGVIELTTK